MFCDMHLFPLQGSLCKTYFTKDDFYEFRNIIITCFLTKLGGGGGSILDLTSRTTHFAGMLTQTQCSVHRFVMSNDTNTPSNSVRKQMALSYVNLTSLNS